ncbi:unnamed protein product [Mycena citricolor]|uniref:Uncharacterized protein n=1 Tax=Mycena citricolor TaxID=2018698 RepID=A0AAD2K6U4_9AGAR|nr:unnamed protein product [Mycena citricolor]CAK5282068.1 unnamed protein product [Mycena citricolor]
MGKEPSWESIRRTFRSAEKARVCGEVLKGCTKQRAEKTIIILCFDFLREMRSYAPPSQKIVESESRNQTVGHC